MLFNNQPSKSFNRHWSYATGTHITCSSSSHKYQWKTRLFLLNFTRLNWKVRSNFLLLLLYAFFWRGTNKNCLLEKKEKVFTLTDRGAGIENPIIIPEHGCDVYTVQTIKVRSSSGLYRVRPLNAFNITNGSRGCPIVVGFFFIRFLNPTLSISHPSSLLIFAKIRLRLSQAPFRIIIINNFDLVPSRVYIRLMLFYVGKARYRIFEARDERKKNWNYYEL